MPVLNIIAEITVLNCSLMSRCLLLWLCISEATSCATRNATGNSLISSNLLLRRMQKQKLMQIFSGIQATAANKQYLLQPSVWKITF